MEEKVRYFMFSYMYCGYSKYAYGRHLAIVKGNLVIREIEEYIARKEGVEQVLVTGFFEMAKEDYNASIGIDS